jgi:protease I
VTAEQSLAEARAGEYDGVVIPGGWAPDSLRQDERVLKLVREMDRSGKVVAAICHGGWVLCSADIIRNRRVTCFKGIKDDLIHAGGRYSDEEVVVDENIITARIPADLPAFCREVAKALVTRVVGQTVGTRA